MRVATWNVQHGRPNPDGAADIAAVGDALAGLGAAVVAVP
jgi:endonuclease/exonuclease/phosphatase family metal-dependent hydrolase